MFKELPDLPNKWLFLSASSGISGETMVLLEQNANSRVQECTLTWSLCLTWSSSVRDNAWCECAQGAHCLSSGVHARRYLEQDLTKSSLGFKLGGTSEYRVKAHCNTFYTTILQQCSSNCGPWALRKIATIAFAQTTVVWTEQLARMPICSRQLATMHLHRCDVGWHDGGTLIFVQLPCGTTCITPISTIWNDHLCPSTMGSKTTRAFLSLLSIFT